MDQPSASPSNCPVSHERAWKIIPEDIRFVRFFPGVPGHHQRSLEIADRPWRVKRVEQRIPARLQLAGVHAGVLTAVRIERRLGISLGVVPFTGTSVLAPSDFAFSRYADTSSTSTKKIVVLRFVTKRGDVAANASRLRHNHRRGTHCFQIEQLLVKTRKDMPALQFHGKPWKVSPRLCRSRFRARWDQPLPTFISCKGVFVSTSAVDDRNRDVQHPEINRKLAAVVVDVVHHDRPHYATRGLLNTCFPFTVRRQLPCAACSLMPFRNSSAARTL